MMIIKQVVPYHRIDRVHHNVTYFAFHIKYLGGQPQREVPQLVQMRQPS